MTNDPVDQKLNEVLDLEPNEVSTMEILHDEPADQEILVKTEEETPEEDVTRETSGDITERNDSMDDYEIARQNIKDMIDKGQRVLNRIMFVVNGSDSARDFEVAAQMIKSLSDMNRDLIKMHKDMYAMKKKGEVKPKGEKNITNNVFMTTDDMLRKIINQQNENNK